MGAYCRSESVGPKPQVAVHRRVESFVSARMNHPFPRFRRTGEHEEHHGRHGIPIQKKSVLDKRLFRLPDEPILIRKCYDVVIQQRHRTRSCSTHSPKYVRVHSDASRILPAQLDAPVT